MASIEDYLVNLTPAQRQEFERVRNLVQQQTPDTEELISYGVPTWKHKKRPLLYFGAFKDHLSLFPASDALVAAHPDLAPYRTGKGTFQYSETRPLSDEQISAIVRFRLDEIQPAQ